MMITDLVIAAFEAGMVDNPGIHKKWISIYHRLAVDSGVAHVGSVASDSRLDMLLRTMEAEQLKRLVKPQAGAADLSGDILISLSECWVLRTYEVIRAAWARSKYPKECKLEKLAYRLGLVRMPIAKGEIQKANRSSEAILLMREGGGEAAPYANDGSYLVPRFICGASGAAMWVVVDVISNCSTEISRRNLSDEFLALYD